MHGAVRELSVFLVGAGRWRIGALALTENLDVRQTRYIRDLWRLGGWLAQVECFVVEDASGFALCVERRGELLVAEMYNDIESVMRGAGELRAVMERAGFTEPEDAERPQSEVAPAGQQAGRSEREGAC